VVRALPLPALDDGTLARRAAENHPGAARVVWDRFSRLVRSLLRRSLGPSMEVEDLV
jgi:RNA polymerase sigma-70 factor (ECF subfamily)